MARLWTRTCQECGHKQTSSSEPSDQRKASPVYGFIACRKCGSEAYDYGSWQCAETDCDEFCDEVLGKQAAQPPTSMED